MIKHCDIVALYEPTARARDKAAVWGGAPSMESSGELRAGSRRNSEEQLLARAPSPPKRRNSLPIHDRLQQQHPHVDALCQDDNKRRVAKAKGDKHPAIVLPERANAGSSPGAICSSSHAAGQDDPEAVSCCGTFATIHGNAAETNTLLDDAKAPPEPPPRRSRRSPPMVVISSAPPPISEASPNDSSTSQPSRSSRKKRHLGRHNDVLYALLEQPSSERADVAAMHIQFWYHSVRERRRRAKDVRLDAADIADAAAAGESVASAAVGAALSACEAIAVAQSAAQGVDSDGLTRLRLPSADDLKLHWQRNALTRALYGWLLSLSRARIATSDTHVGRRLGERRCFRWAWVRWGDAHRHLAAARECTRRRHLRLMRMGVWGFVGCLRWARLLAAVATCAEVARLQSLHRALHGPLRRQATLRLVSRVSAINWRHRRLLAATRTWRRRTPFRLVRLGAMADTHFAMRALDASITSWRRQAAGRGHWRRLAKGLDSRRKRAVISAALLQGISKREQMEQQREHERQRHRRMLERRRVEEEERWQRAWSASSVTDGERRCGVGPSGIPSPPPISPKARARVHSPTPSSISRDKGASRAGASGGSSAASNACNACNANGGGCGASVWQYGARLRWEVACTALGEEAAALAQATAEGMEEVARAVETADRILAHKGRAAEFHRPLGGAADGTPLSPKRGRLAADTAPHGHNAASGTPRQLERQSQVSRRSPAPAPSEQVAQVAQEAHMTQVKFSSPPTAAPPPGERVSEMRWQPAPPLPSLSTQNKPAPASAPSHAALDDAPVPPPTHFSPSKAAPPPAQSHLIKRKLAISRALSPPPSHLPGPAPLASAASSPSRIPVSRRVAARRRLSEGLRSPAVSEREGEGSSRARGAQVECRSDGAVDRLHADSQRLLHVSTAMHAAGDRTLLVLRESDVAALRESMPWSPVKGVQADAKMLRSPKYATPSYNRVAYP